MEHAISSEQVRAARELLRWRQQDLANASAISAPTIKRIEIEPGPLREGRSATAITNALMMAGIEFLAAGRDHGPGVRRRLGRLNDEFKLVPPPVGLGGVWAQWFFQYSVVLIELARAAVDDLYPRLSTQDQQEAAILRQLDKVYDIATRKFAEGDVAPRQINLNVLPCITLTLSDLAPLRT